MSAAYWGKLVNLEASLRKPALIPFGLFNNQDNLAFIADIPASNQYFSQATIPYSTNLSIDVSAAAVLTIPLTGNIASITLNYAGGSSITIGQWVYLRFVQNATGGWTVAWPATFNLDQDFVVDPAPNRATVLPISWNGTAWVCFANPFSVPLA